MFAYKNRNTSVCVGLRHLPRGGGRGDPSSGRGLQTLLFYVEDLHKQMSWGAKAAAGLASRQAAAGWERRKWPGHREQTLAGP